jgi:hypothetical protein
LQQCAGAPSRGQASAVVLALVDGLNQLDDHHRGMIDTLRREEACDAPSMTSCASTFQAR